MNHPASCKTPDTCTLTYREHLDGFVIGVAAIPSRAVTRTEGQPDEPSTRTREREKRWVRDHQAYRELRRAGLRPKSVSGSDRRVKEIGG